jgi:hypothetical protein
MTTSPTGHITAMPPKPNGKNLYFPNASLCLRSCVAFPKFSARFPLSEVIRMASDSTMGTSPTLLGRLGADGAPGWLAILVDRPLAAVPPPLMAATRASETTVRRNCHATNPASPARRARKGCEPSYARYTWGIFGTPPGTLSRFKSLEHPVVKQYIELSCPGCQRPLRVPTQYIGRRIACNRCDHAFSPSASANESMPAPASPPTLADSGTANRRISALEEQIKQVGSELADRTARCTRAECQVAEPGKKQPTSINWLRNCGPRSAEWSSRRGPSPGA